MASRPGSACPQSSREVALFVPQKHQQQQNEQQQQEDLPADESQSLKSRLQQKLEEVNFEVVPLSYSEENEKTASRESARNTNRLVLVLNDSDFRDREFCAELILANLSKPVCIVAESEIAFELLNTWPKLKSVEHLRRFSSTELSAFAQWLKKEIVFFLSVGASNEQFDEFDDILAAVLKEGYEIIENRSNLLEWDAISNNMEKCSRVVAVYFRPPGKIPSHARGHLYHLAIDQCIRLKKKIMCIVKAFGVFANESEDKVFENHRIRHFTEIVEQADSNGRLRRLLGWLEQAPGLPAVSLTFGSLGASFAWQFATGFLCFILPNLQKMIGNNLIDTNTQSVRKQVLDEFGVDADPKKVCVLEKFVILLKEDDLDSAKHVNPYPDKLCDGCTKLTKDGNSLQLKFESPGYPKRTPAYILKLENELVTENATYTHVIFFGCFATPISVLHDITDLEPEEKHNEYRLFREELQFILNHPKANDLLQKFSCMDQEVKSAEKTACVIQLDTDKSASWKSLIRTRIREEVTNQDASDQLDGGCDEETKHDEKALLLKFSKSITEDQEYEFSRQLKKENFKTENFQLMSKSFPQTLLRCKRAILVATLKDLEEFRNDYDSPDYDDKKHKDLMRDITSAVTYMHMREEYNLVVIVITDAKEDIYSVLPPSLKILPEKNVVTIERLDPDNMDEIEYAFTEGITQRGSRGSQFADLIVKLELTEQCTKVDENLPLMSMAYAMAANSCHGFFTHLGEHIKRTEKSELPFDLPYFYVLPKSGRLPEEKGESLQKAFQEIGVECTKQEFLSAGRRYSYKVYRKGKYRVAFEVPPCILNLRKQANCGLGGVKRRDLVRNLNEFRQSLMDILHVKKLDEYFSVTQWDDVTNLPRDVWKHPTKEYAESLWRCLTEASLSR